MNRHRGTDGRPTCDEFLFFRHEQTQGRVTEALVEYEDVVAQGLVRSLLRYQKFARSIVMNLAYHD